jgi:XapX domain-containing protein
MNGYFVSLLMGLAVGAAYGLLQVRSPAPPTIALVGLLGILLGEQAVDLVKRHLAPSAQTRLERRLVISSNVPELPAKGLHVDPHSSQ